MVGLLEHCDYYHNLLGDVGMGENKRAILPERERERGDSGLFITLVPKVL